MATGSRGDGISMKTFVIHKNNVSSKIVGNLRMMYLRSKVDISAFDLKGMFPLSLETYESGPYLNICACDISMEEFHLIWRYLNGDNSLIESTSLALIGSPPSPALISLPMWTKTPLSHEEIEVIKDAVRNIWGISCLHPSIVESIIGRSLENTHPAAIPETLEKIQAIMNEMLKQITLAEKRLLDGDRDSRDYYTRSVFNSCTGRAINFGSLSDEIYLNDMVVRKKVEVIPDTHNKVSLSIAKKLGSFFNETTSLILVGEKYQYCGHAYISPTSYEYGVAVVSGMRESVVNLSCKIVDPPGGAKSLMSYRAALWARKHGFARVELAEGMVLSDEILSRKARDIKLVEIGQQYFDVLEDIPISVKDIEEYAATGSRVPLDIVARYNPMALMGTGKIVDESIRDVEEER